jgi:hypothetical protein
LKRLFGYVLLNLQALKENRNPHVGFVRAEFLSNLIAQLHAFRISL